MKIKWIEQKRRYRRAVARAEQLPPNYRTAFDALQRYAMYFGNGTAEGSLDMTDDLVDLFEQAAADGTPIRSIVGDDPVEFAEAFLRNYPQSHWSERERRRLTTDIDKAAGDKPPPETRRFP